VGEVLGHLFLTASISIPKVQLPTEGRK
jgi:hypothetical protein